ncbi:MAG: glycosyl hydrolase family 28-related protein [Planctomycetia bacterium]|nr:glycosyl hydrolase family 28-related protein [Planctomycetia bacterium]
MNFTNRTSRSPVVRLVVLTAGLSLWTALCQAQNESPVAPESPVPERVSGTATVLPASGHGVVPGIADDQTAALQSLLDRAADSDVQHVFVPRGTYHFNGSLRVPDGVTLSGVSVSVMAHNGIRDHGLPRPEQTGTTFLIHGNAGDENADPFLTLGTNSTVRGICFYYPDQNPETEPTPYPWCIAMRGKNPALLDCELLNAYLGIDATQNERHLIRNISGQPLKTGIFVDAIYDIGRIENVHFNPWWSMKPKLFAWQQQNGVAFRFARSDWQYVFNTFCFGYHIGYEFVATESGECNGNFLGIGADDCYTAVVVRQCAPMGLLITNGEFVSFHGPEPTMVRVESTNRGSVRFVNSAFWGPCRRIAEIDGTPDGVVGFSDCTFTQWGYPTAAQPDLPPCAAISAAGGSLLVRGCEFRQDRPQIELSETLRKCVITDNLMTGPLRIDHPGTVTSPRWIIDDNASDHPSLSQGETSR